MDPRYKIKQFVFQKVTDVTVIHPNGRSERLRFGKYEGVMICRENGHRIPSTITLATPHIPVNEVETFSGIRILFDEPPYFINYTAETMLV